MKGRIEREKPKKIGDVIDMTLDIPEYINTAKYDSVNRTTHADKQRFILYLQRSLFMKLI
jgi:hypothetical protein